MDKFIILILRIQIEVKWNIERVGRKGFQHPALKFLRIYNPEVLVFMTKEVQPDRAKIIITNITYPNFIEIPLDGLAGELWFFFKKFSRLYC